MSSTQGKNQVNTGLGKADPMITVWDGTVSGANGGQLTTKALERREPDCDDVDPDSKCAVCDVCGKQYMKMVLTTKQVCSEQCRLALNVSKNRWQKRKQ